MFTNIFITLTIIFCIYTWHHWVAWLFCGRYDTHCISLKYNIVQNISLQYVSFQIKYFISIKFYLQYLFIYCGLLSDSFTDLNVKVISRSMSRSFHDQCQGHFHGQSQGHFMVNVKVITRSISRSLSRWFLWEGLIFMLVTKM